MAFHRSAGNVSVFFLNLPRRYPNDVDGVAHHVGGAFPALGSLGHRRNMLVFKACGKLGEGVVNTLGLTLMIIGATIMVLRTEGCYQREYQADVQRALIDNPLQRQAPDSAEPRLQPTRQNLWAIARRSTALQPCAVCEGG
jgi:hypothetical protein